VTFFFVLSGFVLAWSCAGVGLRGAEVPARVFYWRRLARVWPLHLLATGLAVAVVLAAGRRLSAAGTLLSLPLLQAWSPFAATAGNPAAWSLSAEAWFYLLLPLLLPVLLRRGDRTLTLLTALACGCGPLLWLAGALVQQPDLRGWLLDYLPLTRTPQFVLGALAGVAVRRGRRSPVGVGTAAAALLLWHLALIPWSAAVPESRWYGPYSASQLLVAPLFALLIAAAAQRDVVGAPGRDGGLLAGRRMRRLGHWSFAWYLVHQSCLRAVLRLFGTPHHPAGTAAGWLLVLATSLALAGALHTWVEQPVEAWLRACGPQARTVPRAQAVPHARKPGPIFSGARLPVTAADQDGPAEPSMSTYE
jgi:peptidoglycan/LPS O-acetylase OafA/YrhL